MSSNRRAFSRTTKAILITSFVLLGALLITPFGLSSSGPHALGTPMGVPASAPFDHIVTILMENENACSVYGGCGGTGTYETQIANQYVYVNTWGTINHNSEPNYIALFGAINDGSTSGDGVCCYFEPGQNLVDKMETAGITWTAFAEDAGNSGTCSFSPPRSGDHFGFIDFTDMNTAARCAHFQTTASSSDPEFLAALNAPNPSNFIWLTPNDNDNGHDSGVSGGDSYLAALVPHVLASTEFTTTRATLLIVYDEGYSQCTNTGGTGECVYASFSGPAAKQGVQISPANASHYSYAATIEAAWGLTSINANDAGAPNMLSAFNPACTSNCPLSTSFTTAPSLTLVNAPVTFTATTTGGTSPYMTAWNFGDGSTGSGLSTSHTYTSTGSFTITETATDSSSPAKTASSSKTLTISAPQPPTTSLTLVPSSPTVNTLITFTAVTTGGTAPYSTNWTFGDGSIGSGTVATHTYTSAGSFTVSETSTDSSAPQKTATASQSITVFSSLTGNFGSCASLPQGWNCGNIVSGAPSPTSAQIVNGVFESRESNPGLGGPNQYYYSTTQKGTFPWTPCTAPATGVIPTGVTSVSVNFTSLVYNPGSSPSADRYHIYIALYYWLPNGPVTSGSSTYQCLDTQSRVENVGGNFSPIGSTATYDPGDAFGWDNVTLQVSPGQTGLLVANVANLCQGDLQAWGIPTSTPCQLAGIEIGTEGYQFQELDVNWYSVGLNVGPVPTSTSFTVSPSALLINTPAIFTSLTFGGIAPYTISWNFGDGATGSGAIVSHTYTTANTYTVIETATDSSSPSKIATSTQQIIVYTSLPLSATFSVSSSTPQVGQTVTFTATALGGASPYTYSVDFGDGNTATGTSVSHAYSTVTSYTATLTVTDSALPQAATVSKSIVINIQSVAPTLTLVPDQTVVAGSWINFTVTAASNAGGTVTLSATGLPAGASFDPSTGDFSWKPSQSQTGTYVIVFTATDSSAPSAPTSKSMQVQVNQAAPGGSNGGNGGSGGSSSGGCLFCNVIPKVGSTFTLLVVGGLLGLVFSLALLTFRARASLEQTKRRMRRLNQE